MLHIDPHNSHYYHILDMSLLHNDHELFYCEELTSDRLNYFIETLNDNNPGYWSSAWSDYIINGNDVQVKTRLDALFTKLINAAEFQLM